MIIRPTVAADLPALQQVLNETGLFPSEMLPELMGTYFREPSGNEVWLTCEVSAAPIGFACAKSEELTEGTWNMLAIAVAPGHHRSGAGSALIAKLEAVLRSGSSHPDCRDVRTTRV